MEEERELDGLKNARRREENELINDASFRKLESVVRLGDVVR